MTQSSFFDPVVKPAVKPPAVVEKAVEPVKAPITKLSKAQIFNNLVEAANKHKIDVERYHTVDPDKYGEAMQHLEEVYVLLALLYRDEVESFRLKIRKEIIRIEKELDSLEGKLAVTRGDKSLDAIIALSMRHLRVADQYDALSRALRATGRESEKKIASA